jgi:hypothetical protein
MGPLRIQKAFGECAMLVMTVFGILSDLFGLHDPILSLSSLDRPE